jgi:hypothetical protein
MKLKTFTQEEFINFIKYVKMNVSFADNVIITLCKEIKHVILYINIISSDMQNNINLQLNNECKITVVSGTIPQDKIELIEKYIYDHLYLDDKYEIEI